MAEFTVHFETLGCRLNQIESESAARFFAAAGFAVDMESMVAAFPAPPQTVLSVVNTCTVTGKAEQKARRLIRLLLRKMPGSCVLVTGCYAELEAEAIQAIDSRICVLPGSRKDLLADLPRRLKSYLETAGWKAEGDGRELTRFIHDTVAGLCLEKPASTNTKSRHDGGQDKTHGEESQSKLSRKISSLAPPPKKEELVVATGVNPVFRLSTDTFFAHSRSSIKIQDGCNCECSYCRIHLARGRSVSLQVDEVVRRVRQLEAAGQQEVVLTGVNLSQYRGQWSKSGTPGGLNLGELLQQVLLDTSTIRIRLSSLYPESVTPQLCQVIAHRRIQPYFHLSVQSGSDKILNAMRRPYRSAQVYQAVELLRRAKGNPFIACDIIAGFPGETEEDFALTQSLCQTCSFAWVHAFPFSPRPGTPAATMQGQVPQSVAGQRVKWLGQFAIQSKCSYISMWKGQVVSAITEHNRQDRKNPSSVESIDSAAEGRSGGAKQLTHAVTENFIHVELVGSYPQGTSIRVKITGPLLHRIQAGDECEASGEAVEDAMPARISESDF